MDENRKIKNTMRLRENDGDKTKRRDRAAGWAHLEADDSAKADDEDGARQPPEAAGGWGEIFKLWAVFVFALPVGAVSYFWNPPCGSCVLPNMLSWAAAHFVLLAVIVGGLFLSAAALARFWRGGLFTAAADAKTQALIIAELRGVRKIVLLCAAFIGPGFILLISARRVADSAFDFFLAIILGLAAVVICVLQGEASFNKTVGRSFLNPAIIMAPFVFALAALVGLIVWIDTGSVGHGIIAAAAVIFAAMLLWKLGN
jgi:hypothetical protein